MPLEPIVEKEIKRLSDDTGLTVEEIRGEVEQIITNEKKSPYGAVTVWKSRHGNQLNGKTATVTFRLLEKSNLQDSTWTDGTAHKRVWIKGFILDEGVVELKSLPVTDEAIQLTESMEIGSVYEFDAKILFDSDQIRLLGSTIVKSSASMPELKDLADSSAIDDINDITDYIGTSSFFKVFVGKAFKTAFGNGIEVATIGSNPITAWLSPEMPVPEEGEEILLYGFVRKDGTIKANGIF